MDQIEQLAKQINIPYYISKEIKDPLEIAKNGMEKFKKYDILIFDSAGRDALDKELADELKKLGELIKPDEVILTIPADLGQAAGPQASEFNKLVGINSIFLTKIDGTAKGGGALTACAVTGAKVKFIGTGEKVDAIEVFEPERFVSRLIGFGDMKTLLEKAEEAVKPEKAKQLAESMTSGKFTMNEFFEQLQSMQKMGSLKSVMGMVPGMGMMKLPKDFDVTKQEGKMKKWGYIIQSMTKKERTDPSIINAPRIKRIAKGSGTSEAEVRDLLTNYNKMKKMMKMVSGGMKKGMLAKLMKKFKGFR